MTDLEYASAPHSSPPAGDCAFCGYPDKRHRMWDVLADLFVSGESIAWIAEQYRMTPDVVEQWLRLKLTAPRRDRHPARRRKL
jgi:hypothetical protein